MSHRWNGASSSMPPPVPLSASAEVLEKNSGRVSRSIRLMTSKPPKISACLPTPTPNVTGNLEMLAKPWPSFMLSRYTLNENLLFGSTSPVGMYHSPVSPSTVVTAGRTSPVEGGGGAAEESRPEGSGPGLAWPQRAPHPGRPCRIVVSSLIRSFRIESVRGRRRHKKKRWTGRQAHSPVLPIGKTTAIVVLRPRRKSTWPRGVLAPDAPRELHLIGAEGAAAPVRYTGRKPPVLQGARHVWVDWLP